MAQLSPSLLMPAWIDPIPRLLDASQSPVIFAPRFAHQERIWMRGTSPFRLATDKFRRAARPRRVLPPVPLFSESPSPLLIKKRKASVPQPERLQECGPLKLVKRETISSSSSVDEAPRSPESPVTPPQQVDELDSSTPPPPLHLPERERQPGRLTYASST